MTEIPIAVRIPRGLEKELGEYMKSEHLERSVAIRRLLFAAIEEWKVKFALKLLEEGRTTISKAAEIAGLDIWSFIAKIKESGIRWVKDEVIEADLKEFG